MHSDTKKNKKKEHLNDIRNVILKITYKKKDVIGKWKIGFALMSFFCKVCLLFDFHIFYFLAHFQVYIKSERYVSVFTGKQSKTTTTKTHQISKIPRGLETPFLLARKGLKYR